MRAVAGKRRLASRVLAILRAVFLSIRANTTAGRMRTFLGFRHGSLQAVWVQTPDIPAELP